LQARLQQRRVRGIRGGVVRIVCDTAGRCERARDAPHAGSQRGHGGLGSLAARVASQRVILRASRE
jgi:hypothetical protein